MTLRDALRTAFTAANGRTPADGHDDAVEQIDWTYGIVGLIALALVQAGLIYVSRGQVGPDVLRDLTIVAVVALAMPFVIFAIVAAVTGQLARLPAAFLYLGIVLAALQLVTAVLSNFGVGSSGFLVGILGAISFLAAKGFLKLAWPGAASVALLVVVAFIGAGLLVFVLPSASTLG